MMTAKAFTVTTMSLFKHKRPYSALSVHVSPQCPFSGISLAESQLSVFDIKGLTARLHPKNLLSLTIFK